jgi:5-methylcytosine-specific restriction endonuclease McrA
MTALESSRRLAEMLHREHVALADFLVALAEFDEAGHFRQLGFSTLFDFLHRELGLSRGAAHYRKVAARLVHRFPEVALALREGKLCITSVVELSKVVTEENHAEVIPRFFHCSRQEAKEVAVEIDPAKTVPRRDTVTVPPLVTPSRVHPVEPEATHPEGVKAAIEPLNADLRRLHVTVSRTFLAKLERARAGQSHVQPLASAEQVLEAALDLLLAKQERRGSRVPARVKRDVLQRDQHRCQWPLATGGVCGSTVRLQVDHVVPAARGGPSTVDNCRILCAVHNQEAARNAYGGEWMDQFVRRTLRVGEPVEGYGEPRRQPSAGPGLTTVPAGVSSRPHVRDPSRPAPRSGAHLGRGGSPPHPAHVRSRVRGAPRPRRRGPPRRSR